MRAPSMALLVLALGACDPFVFDDLQDSAGVVVLEAPDGYPSRSLGAVLTGFDGSLGGTEVSRIAAGGGTNMPLAVHEVWNGRGLALGNALYQACDDPGDCDRDAGAAVAGIPSWRPGSPASGEMCLLIGSPTADSVTVRCEEPRINEPLMGPAGTRLGASLASLAPGSAAGVAIVGAPGANSGDGAIYRIPDGSNPVQLSVPVSAIAARGGLGSAIAVAPLPGGATLVVAGAPGARRVLVLVVSSDGMGGVVTNLRSCIDGPEDGFGGVVAAGDVDGDSWPEVFVSRSADAMSRTEMLVMLPGTGLPDPGGCSAAWGEGAVPIPCPAGLDSATCGRGYGSALAIGDVDADGLGDLIVGDPSATARGHEDAGAVFVLPGHASGLDGMRADALTLSSAEPGDSLGAVVATVRTDLDAMSPRVEVVAGAPGAGSVALFLCSGLEGDTLAVGQRCTP